MFASISVTTSCINVHARYTNVISDLSCPAIADNQSPVPFQFYAGHILTFFISLLFTCCFGFFPLLLCHFPQFLLLIEKLPSFFAQPKNNTSNKCKIRKMKSGFLAISGSFATRQPCQDYAQLNSPSCFIFRFLLGFTVCALSAQNRRTYPGEIYIYIEIRFRRTCSKE